MTKKIKRYDILTSSSREDMVKLVNAAITDGWQPYSAPTSTIESTNDSYVVYHCQAMVKYQSVNINPQMTVLGQKTKQPGDKRRST